MCNFAFLESEWPDMHEAASSVERLVMPDPPVACSYARQALKLTVDWMYKDDETLRLPHDDPLAALLFKPTSKNVVAPAVWAKTRRGVIEPGRLYESPLTDLRPDGPDGVFTSRQVDGIISVLHAVTQRAAR